MAAIEASKPTRVWFPNELGPLTTTVASTALALAAGLTTGYLGAVVWTQVFDLSWGLSYVPFWIGGLAVLDFVYKSCPEGVIEVGYVGVPTFKGKRVRFGVGNDENLKKTRDADGHIVSEATKAWLISEGRPKLFPGFWFIPVDVRRDTSDPRDVVLLSKDGTLMRVKLVFEREVVDPFLWLSAKRPDDSIYDIAEAQARDAFSDELASDLVKSGTKQCVVKKMKDAIDEHDHEYGLNVTMIFEPEVLPPQALIDELLKIQLELAQAKHEAANIETVRKLVAKLVDDDKIDVKLAYEFVQAERGKAPASRQTFRLEGIDELAKVLQQALALLAARSASTTPPRGRAIKWKK